VGNFKSPKKIPRLWLINENDSLQIDYWFGHIHGWVITFFYQKDFFAWLDYMKQFLVISLATTYGWKHDKVVQKVTLLCKN
jgi:hypothetical protein